MNVTIGILAHVDAGKTTLSEQLLYRGGTLRSCGRVDWGDACLDFTEVERSRGITVFSAQASFAHGGNRYFLLDTPGHADFSPEMERCLAALDCAVLVVSAADGVQAHTEKLWRLLEARQVPTLVFLNKTDIPGADPAAVLDAMRLRFGDGFCRLDGEWTDEVREQIAVTDEEALEAYLEGRLSDDDCWETAARAASRPAALAGVLRQRPPGEGIDALLDGLDRLCRTHYDPKGSLELLVYQIRRDRQGARTALCKVLSGTLRPRQSVAGEKVHEVRRCNGAKWEPLEAAEAGELAAVTGLAGVRAGDRVGETILSRTAPPSPPLLARVEADVPPTRLLEVFRTLEDEEPTLCLQWNEALRQLHIAVAGEIQLEVLAQTARERFGLEVAFGEPEVAYRETIAAPVRGCGHFEPLRHYAEVHLLLEPTERGSGVTFASRCPTDALPLHYQRLIETHVLEKQHVGALTGSPLTDVRVVLLAGKAHDKHTEGGDFRQAVYRAIRQALFQAETVLLEPWYRVTAEAEPAVAGRIQADVTRMGGVCDAPETLGAAVRVTGRCPVAPMLPYSREFAAMTRGRGSLRLEPDGCEPCRNTAEVAEAIGYDRERDTENPADSVFCSHGAGRTIPWDQAAAMMHIQLD